MSAPSAFPPPSVDIRAHPHPNSTVTMPSNIQSDSYDASARPTPFLMAGFNPQSRLRKTGLGPAALPSSQDSDAPPVVTVVSKPPPSKLSAAQLAPVSYVFTPPSVTIPSSADYKEPIVTRPRARSSHETTSPRSFKQQTQQPETQTQSWNQSLPDLQTDIQPPRQVVHLVTPTNQANGNADFATDWPSPSAAARAAAMTAAAGRGSQFTYPTPTPPPPHHETKTHVPSPAHVDDKFLDFFSSAANVSSAPPTSVSTASTTTSTPVTQQRTLAGKDSDDESDEDESSDESADDSPVKKDKKKKKPSHRKGKKKSSSAPLSAPDQHKLLNLARWLDNVDFYWVCHEADLVSSAGFGITKHHVTWRFVLDNRLHELELFHSKFSGKRRIRLDTVELVNEKVLFDGGSSHEIFIGDHLLEVLIFTESGPLTFGYELIIEGLPFQRAKQQWIRETKQRLAGHEDLLKGDKPVKKTKEDKLKRFIQEEQQLKPQLEAATSHIKRKGSRG